MRPLSIACVQTGPGAEDIAGNVARGIALLDGAGERQRDLVVFDELFNTRFFAVDRLETFDEYFEPIPGPTTERLTECARRYNTNIIAGIGERAADGRYYNSAVIIARNGDIVGVYRKTHIPLIAAPEARATFERNYFTPGDALPVFDLDCVRLGVLICYDRHFPEAWRKLAMGGAELIALPTGARSWNVNWRSGMWEALLRTMAYVNGVFVAGVNRAGVEGATTYTGDSMIVSPVGGTVVNRAPQEEIDCVIESILDLDDVTRAAQTIPFRRDLRPELYA